jgi:hypothetical protein
VSRTPLNFATCHSHPQSLDSASTPEAFAEREVELGTGVITCTDHGTLQACRKVYDLGKAKGLIPVLGLEGYFRDDNCPILTAAGVPKNDDGKFSDYLKYCHITIHFLDQAAYECGVRLLSKADERAERHGSERKPLFDWANLEELSAYNVTMTTGCMIGMVQRHLLNNDDLTMATKYFERLQSIVKPGNLYVELNPHDCSKNWVQGVFVTMADGTKLKFHAKKWVRTNVGEIQVDKLARAWAMKTNDHKVLLSVKDYSTWRDMPEVQIVSVDHIEDFMQNECRPWAPDGDVQAGLNKVMRGLAKRYGCKVLIGDDSHYAKPDEKVVQDVRLAQSGSWRFYGCFERRTPVDMADGTSKPIAKLKVGDVVKTYDFATQSVTSAPITAVIPSAATEASFIANEFLGYGGRGQRRAIVSTPTHHFWTEKGWEEIGATNSRIGIRASAPTEALMEVLDGTLLGDAHISMAGRRRSVAYFAYGHAEDQRCLTEMVAGYLGDTNPKRQRREAPRQDFFTTNSAHPLFAELRKRWYPNGQKRVPRDLVLTPRMLAWWFMDDGSVCRSRPRKSPSGGDRSRSCQARFYTNGFPEEDVDYLIAQLGALGIAANKYEYGKGWFITLCKTAWEALSGLVAPYVPTALRYKLCQDGKEVAAFKEADLDCGWSEHEQVYCVATKKARPLPTGKPAIHTDTKYDIEVAGHHCFFVDGLLVHNSYHRQSSAEAFNYFQTKLFVKEAEFEGWVENSHEWADRFKGFVFDSTPSLPTKFYEVKYEERPWYKEGNVHNSLRYMMELVQRHGRMDWKNPVYVTRLRAEIALLHENGTIDLLPYFMLDEEVCSLYESKGLLTGPGRGSAAGLLLAYLIGITHVDPIRYELSMDRFLTQDRIASGKLPDVDQDLPHRELLVDPEHGWLKQRFGDHYAQISVDSTLKLKMAVKDVSRSRRGHVPPELEVWTKKFIMPPQGVNDYDFVLGYENDEGHVQGSVEFDPALRDYIAKYPGDWEIVQKCLGLARSKGRHACAFVVANRPIHEFIPLTTISDVRVTAYTAASVEAVGGLKMDFLVVNSLNDLGDAIQLIQRRHAHSIDMTQYKVVEHDDELVGWGGPRFTSKRFSLILNGRRVPCQRLVPLNGQFYDIWDLPTTRACSPTSRPARLRRCSSSTRRAPSSGWNTLGTTKDNGDYAIDSVESHGGVHGARPPRPARHPR